MRVINVSDCNAALKIGLAYLLNRGVVENSRNGEVLVAPEPVTTVYSKPNRRVLNSPIRNANPFFHVMESLWMLAGRQDVAWPAKFVKNMVNYSDDGVTLSGAYGNRWRQHFGVDQLAWVVDTLCKDPTTRRCVVSMWDVSKDTEASDREGKDIPCNTHVYFSVHANLLRMTVCCRSNDVLWGAYGSNYVHFTFLMEYIANQLGIGLGQYSQISNNYHVYLRQYPREVLRDIVAEPFVRYPDKVQCPLISSSVTDWHRDLENFLDFGASEQQYTDRFFPDVAKPMYDAWTFQNKGMHLASLFQCAVIKDDGWRRVCTEWVLRKMNKL